MSIPVQNIYYLLCYAWDHVQEGRRIQTGGETFAGMADMLGHVLSGVVAGLLKAGLDRSYVVHAGAIPGIRGKLDVSETVQRQLPWTGRTYCHFDEFSHDVLQNQLIKATLRLLLATPRLHPKVRAEIRGVILHMRDISDVSIQRRDFSRVQVHRNNKGYDFALKLCRLVYENVLVDRTTGHAVFHDFREDDARMGAVFEDFLFNFFRREQKQYWVRRPHIQWYQASGSQHDLQRLPIMRTDIVLRRPGATLVMDAKYYRKALSGQFRHDKVRAAHLYQIFAYLENLEPTTSDALEGILLYPVVEEAFAYDYRLHGHRIRVASINLDQPWPMIRSDLLALIVA